MMKLFNEEEGETKQNASEAEKWIQWHFNPTIFPEI